MNSCIDIFKTEKLVPVFFFFSEIIQLNLLEQWDES